MIWPTGDDPNAVQGPKGDCELAVRRTPPGLPNYLSKRMLKSLYLLFDLENNIISAALTDFNSTADNIIPVPTNGLSAIPTTAFSPTSNPNHPSNQTAAATPTATANANASSPSGHDGKGLITKVSLAVGVPIVIFALVGLIYFIDKRLTEAREKRERDNATRAADDEVPVHNMPPDYGLAVLHDGSISELPSPMSSYDFPSPQSRYRTQMGDRRSSQQMIDAGEIVELP